MKKVFIILFSFILFISCDSMNGDFETSVQEISQKEILDVQNAKKDTVEIVINNKDGFVYIIENDKIVSKTIIENQSDYTIIYSVGLSLLISGLFVMFFIGVIIGIHK